MKNILFTFVLLLILMESIAQKVVYNASGDKIDYKKEDLDIEFDDKTGVLARPEVAAIAPALFAAIPAVIDIGFQLTTKALDKKAKKYSAEYTVEKSFLKGGTTASIPGFSVIRKIAKHNNAEMEDALAIHLKPVDVPDMNAFIYYVEWIDLKYSSAKLKTKYNNFDYTIQLKLTFLVGEEKKVIESTPIVVSSVHFAASPFQDGKYRTSIMVKPEGGICTDVSIKVVETNPYQVRAEKVLALWNDNKDNVKTIVNNFIPKEKEK